MRVGVVRRVRALDGAELFLVRPVEFPAVPAEGTTVKIDGEFMRLVGLREALVARKYASLTAMIVRRGRSGANTSMPPGAVS